MNTSTKCNCCACEEVCKYKELYKKGVDAILNATISYGETNDTHNVTIVKDCQHIEVSIRCPHIISHSQNKKQL